MNLLEITPFVIIVMLPLLAGALKGYSSNKLVRISVDFVVPTVSAIFVTYSLDILLVSTQIVTESSFSTNILYVSILVIITIACWCGFFRLVWFGDKIADREHAGIQNDFKNSAEITSLTLGPMFKSFDEKLVKNIEQIMTDKNNDVFSYLKGMDNTNTDLMTKINRLVECIKEQNKKIDELSKRQSKTDSVLEQVTQYFAKIPHLYEMLLSRIESIDILDDDQKKQDSAPKDDSTNTAQKTTLTTQDGIANLTIGHKHQDDMAMVLEKAGFDVENRHGVGQPDYILRKKNNDTIIAIGSNKSYSLYDEPKRMQRRITAKDCQPELIWAKKIQVPIVLFITNKRNGRRWMKVISPSDLDDWIGESTPVMLAKDDNDSEVMLREGFSNTIIDLGGEA